jgi:hypothetical protein
MLGAVAAVLGVMCMHATSAVATQLPIFVPASFSGFGPTGPETFSHPTAIAVDHATSEVFVSDGVASHAVDIFGLEGGSEIGTIEGTGSETFDFGEEIAGLAVDTDPASPSYEDLYVSDVEHGVVDKFKRMGPHNYRYECHFNGWYGPDEEACHPSGGVPRPEEEFVEPLGVDTDAEGNVYIASYNPNNGAVDEFSGSGKGVLNIPETEHPAIHGHPKYVDVDSTGDVFVLNYSDEEKVAEFQRKSLTGPVESEGSFPVSLFAIAAIAIDQTNNDLFFDFGNEARRYAKSSLEEYNLEGRFGENEFVKSQGIAVDGVTGTVYVSDLNTHSVSAYVEKLATVPDIKGGCTDSLATATSAVLGGEVNPLETAGASYTFEYGIKTRPYEQQAGGPLAGNGFQPVTTEASGLEPGTLYHCRVSSTDTEAAAGGAVAHGPDSTFETPPLPPVIEKATATSVTSEGAVLNALVNPGSSTVNPGSDAGTHARFLYGTEKGHLTHKLPSFGVGAGLAPTAVQEGIPVGTLAPGTTYYFALEAGNAAETVLGPEEGSFTTAPPLVQSGGGSPFGGTGPATAVGLHSATLAGVVVPNGLPTMYEFEFDTSPYNVGERPHGTVLFGGRLEPEAVEVGEGVAQEVGNLQSGTTYHYRVVAFNTDGAFEGGDASFTTPAPPAGAPQPATLAILATPTFREPKYPKVKVKKHKPKKKRSKSTHRAKARKPKRK